MGEAGTHVVLAVDDTSLVRCRIGVARHPDI